MVFRKKSYQEIVQEIVEHVTRGTVREQYDYDVSQTRYKLGNSPVKEIVKVDGFVRASRRTFRRGPDYRQAGDMLEWITGGGRPDPGTTFSVNYTFGEPSGITDANPGSVVRTIIEAIAREVDFYYEEMQHVYDAGFIDSSSTKALEMVVSLLGIDRTPPQSAKGTVTFGRVRPPDEVEVTGEVYVHDGKRTYEMKTQPVSSIKQVKGTVDDTEVVFDLNEDYSLEDGSLKWLPRGRVPEDNSSFTVSYVAYQKIVVPKGVAVTTLSRDPQKTKSFFTKEEKMLLPQEDGKWEAAISVEASTPGKLGNVPAGAIQVMPRPPSGVEYVVNKQDILTGVDPESDEQLRVRAKKALESAGKATLVSVESSIRRIEGVRSILIQDRPDNVPGIIRVVVDGGESDEIERAINETRSAGIYVEFQRPKVATIDVNATAIARRGANPASVQSAIEERIRSYLSKLEIGEDVVYSRLMATVLEGEDVYDVEDLALSVRREETGTPTIVSGENISIGPEERAQVRNVSLSVKARE